MTDVAPIVLNAQRFAETSYLVFLRELYEHRYPHALTARWVTDEALTNVPGRILMRIEREQDQDQALVVSLDDAVVHVALNELTVAAQIAATSDAAAKNALDVLRSALPDCDEQTDLIPMSFWLNAAGRPAEFARLLPAPGWVDIRSGYSGTARTWLDRLAEWDRGPGASGRLLLLHGPPGTGKSTVVRSLGASWRSWASLHFVTDPERFLQDPNYLLQVARAGEGSSDWTVIVLEDAGEYLASDARQTAGQGLSRLLNLCDGALGEAMRILVVVTTNEPARRLHPALMRPGRCIAEVELPRLTRGEIADWATERGARPPDLESASLAELHHAPSGATWNGAACVGFTG